MRLGNSISFIIRLSTFVPVTTLLWTAPTTLSLSQGVRRFPRADTTAGVLRMTGPGRTTEADYARIFGGSRHPPAADALPSFRLNIPPESQILEQCPWQEKTLRSRFSPHRELASWYLYSWRKSISAGEVGSDDGIARWGVNYRTYADEYVHATFSRSVHLQAGDRVFDSATGSGWLARALTEAYEREHGSCGDGPIRWCGNDILPDALAMARRDVAGGQFVLGDSANLTFVPPGSFDAAVCGYVEPSPDAAAAAGYEDVRAWFGNWVAQMARIVRPGGQVCVGAVQDDIGENLGNGGTCQSLGRDWWSESAASNLYGWDVEAGTVEILPLTSDILKKEWGQRYCVRLLKKLPENRTMETGGEPLK
eukprot:CAMPEP_0194332486 /NCGR_PEP_ID=MMETSP0171-20130528/59299_1 /TAXON_ID=218684 /ORGANISM="Corethron pennatum, Strain L29A3" /LENGTH=365 /DNA_ID=CAMNT_0039094359 /DNA_START=8 /DNA_END=1105 /DNA_ORIENTATION=-